MSPDYSSKIPYLPDRIQGLGDVALNVSWRWNREARRLFKRLDPTLWSLSRHNPIQLLRQVEPARLATAAQDPDFLALCDRVIQRAEEESHFERTWFHREYPDLGGRPVAYFCAEFGFHNSVPIYSGGLGVLAGDHAKAASDLGVPMVAVGLMYSKGYFDQRITLDGWQEDSDELFDPTLMPLIRVRGGDGGWPVASVRTGRRTVHVGVWHMQVGRVSAYLLDTDLEENDPEDRELTHKLYGGGLELRLRQEWVLGVGGVRILRALGIEPGAWHANEGHAAFMMVERLRELTHGGMPFEDALREVRARSIFTTHTPVPAGHDSFSDELIEHCTSQYWEDLGVEKEAFLRLGHHPTLNHRTFHMTAAAIRLSASVNGVSKRHGLETRRIWGELWPGRKVEDVPIGYVTNGVHLETWMAHRVMRLLDDHLGDDWPERIDQPEMWDQVLGLDDEALWKVHKGNKGALLAFIREQARTRWRDHWEEAAHLVGAGVLLGREPLTIGFARRFATYKRADLLFRDPERLRALLVNPWRPVQLIFAGKAHPADDEGKRALQRVYSFTRDAAFEGRIAFLEDYELHVAHRLVQGVDLWLNLPRVPLEASGTSGMKAALNGVPQLGTLDGWWAEGFTGTNGWAIPLADPDGDPDQADWEQLFQLLEREVVPLFYERDHRDVPVGWVKQMKHAMRVAALDFTTGRMVRDYAREYYVPALRGDVSDDAPPTA